MAVARAMVETANQMIEDLGWTEVLSPRQKSFISQTRRFFKSAEKAFNEAMEIASEAIPTQDATATATADNNKKNRVPFVAPEMDSDNEWDKVQETLIKAAFDEEQLKRKMTNGGRAHPRCSVCNSRHCSWDHERNNNWGRPAKPSKAHK